MAIKLKSAIFSITILSLVFRGLAVDAQNFPWKKISDTRFVVYYQEDDLQNSKKILNTLQTSYLRLSRELGVELVDTVSVFITPSKKVFRQLVGDNFPQWSDGVATPLRNIIILKSARWMPPETNNNAIAVHELTHIFVNRATHGKPIPRWFNEGLAVYYSGEKGFASGTLVSKALITNSIISLSDIDEVLQFHANKAQLAYQQSYLAVVFLFRNYGKEAVKKILAEVANGISFNQAFIDVLDADVWEFEEQWYQYIKRKYRWHFLVEFENYLWVLALVLFLVGFVLMRRRNKKTIQRWQEEDDITEL